MLGNCADSGSWAMHSPPTALIACAPAVPLEPMPLMMMQIARSRCSSARLLKKSSIGRLAARGVPSRGPRCSRPSRIVSVVAGADDVDVVRLDRHAVLDLEHRHRRCAGRGSRPSGSRGPAAGAGRGRTPSRCRAGMASRNSPTASSPPAEAPMPTTGNGSRGGCSASTGWASRSGSSSGCRRAAHPKASGSGRPSGASFRAGARRIAPVRRAPGTLPGPSRRQTRDDLPSANNPARPPMLPEAVSERPHGVTRNGRRARAVGRASRFDESIPRPLRGRTADGVSPKYLPNLSDGNRPFVGLYNV